MHRPWVFYCCQVVKILVFELLNISCYSGGDKNGDNTKTSVGRPCAIGKYFCDFYCFYCFNSIYKTMYRRLFTGMIIYKILCTDIGQ